MMLPIPTGINLNTVVYEAIKSYLKGRGNNMKKRIILLTLLLVFAVLMPGCGGKDGKTVDITQTKQPAANNDQQGQDKDKGKETEKEEPSNSDDLSYLTTTYQDPDNDAVINGPNLISFYEAASQLWNAGSRYFIIVGFYKDYWGDVVDREAIKTVEDIIPNMKRPIILSSHAKSYTDIRDVVVTSQERVTVNGREASRFKGYFDCESEDGTVKNRYIVGYALFYKDEPMYLLGTVSSNDQEQEYIDEVTKTVDDMIKTLRDGE